MIEIPLTRGKVALIDDADFDLISRFKWSAYKSKNTYYAHAGVRLNNGSRTTIQMHRLLLGLTDPKIKTDHRDRNGLNNSRANLRACSHAENGRNRTAQANNSSGYKGVSFHKQHEKWQARIMVNGKSKHLGFYLTPEDAHQAYCAAAAEFHGEFANVGNPPAKKWSKPAFEYIYEPATSG